jgi:Bacterial archaeo-eukaryotic release factor family 7
MRPFDLNELRKLLVAKGGPCVSLFMPTHRGRDGLDQDPIRYKNLLSRANELLRTGHRGAEVRSLMAPVESLSERAFWTDRMSGLAVFRSPDEFAFYRVPLELPELAVVADNFHTKPLLHYLQTELRFFILALSQNKVSLYQAGRYDIGPVDLLGLPTSLRDALGIETGVEEWRGATGAGSRGKAVFHGSGAGKPDRKDDVARYMRRIDEALWEYLRSEMTPLVLAAVGYYHPIYREVSRYPFLVEKGVDGNVERLSAREIHRKALPLVEEFRIARVCKRCDRYGSLLSSGRSIDKLEDVARAAVRGRVQCLFLREGHRVWGHFERESGAILLKAEQTSAADEDVLDAISEETLIRDGEVFVLSLEDMPTDMPIAAVLRY